jgi:signal peptidase I
MSEEKKKINWIKELGEYILWLAGAFLVVQLITHFIGVPSIVDGASMEPNFHDGEYLWVDMVGYYFHEPERYDVVIFPVDNGFEETHYIKRVIGLPGETVYIDEKGGIFVNNEQLPDIYGKEVIRENNRHLAKEPITLGEDEYFVLGDNRNHSSDSRLATVGNISKDRILGRVVARLWPFDKLGLIK